MKSFTFALLSLLSPQLTSAVNTDDTNDDVCLLYLAESTIPGAGLGMFAGSSFAKGQLIGRNVGDAAFPTTDQDWHNSPAGGFISKNEGDYHWPLTNYDWNGMSCLLIALNLARCFLTSYFVEYLFHSARYWNGL